MDKQSVPRPREADSSTGGLEILVARGVGIVEAEKDSDLYLGVERLAGAMSLGDQPETSPAVGSLHPALKCPLSEGAVRLSPNHLARRGPCEALSQEEDGVNYRAYCLKD